MCDLQTIQYFYRDMKINGFGSRRCSVLSPGAGGVDCLDLQCALLRAGWKQLLPLPGRTLLKSLSCSKELCCLILFFLNTFNITRWCCLIVHCWVVRHSHTRERCCTNCTEDISLCGVWTRPGRSHSISNWRSSSLGGRGRRLGGGLPHAVQKLVKWLAWSHKRRGGQAQS